MNKEPSFHTHSDLINQNVIYFAIDATPGVPVVSKNPDNQTEVYSAEMDH